MGDQPENRGRTRGFTRIFALVATLAMVLAACTGGGDETAAPEITDGADGATEAGQTAADGDGAQGDRLVYGVPPPTRESNDVNRDMQPQDEFQLKPMYENLVGVDPETGEWVPMLASEWEVTEDESGIRFMLREGVQFHGDNGEFTAKDVVFTFNHLTEPAGAVSGVAEVMRESVEEIEVVNEHEVIFHLNELNYAFLEGLSYGAAGMAIKSKADWDARGGESPGLDEAPIAGTGPWQFVERTQGENVVFEAVPWDHWRKNPGFAELEYRYMPENSTRLSALIAGEIDVTQLPEALTAEAVSQGAEAIESEIPGRRIGMNFIGAALEDPPLENCDNRVHPDSPIWDRAVRRAVNKAIDRQALNEAFFGGEAEPMIMWYWQPELRGWNPDWEEQFDEVYGYDPEAARQLLQEAGYSEGEPTIKVLASQGKGGPEGPDIAEAVAGMLSDVGFDAPIVTMDAEQHDAMRENDEFRAALEVDHTGSEAITGFDAQGVAHHGSGRSVENCRIDRMYQEVETTLNEEEQAEAYRELGNFVFDYVQHVPLFRVALERVVNPETVADYTFPGAGMSAPYSFTEYIEPASEPAA